MADTAAGGGEAATRATLSEIRNAISEELTSERSESGLPGLGPDTGEADAGGLDPEAGPPRFEAEEIAGAIHLGWRYAGQATARELYGVEVPDDLFPRDAADDMAVHAADVLNKWAPWLAQYFKGQPEWALLGSLVVASWAPGVYVHNQLQEEEEEEEPGPGDPGPEPEPEPEPEP